MEKDPLLSGKSRYIAASQLLSCETPNDTQIILFSQGLSNHARGIIAKFGPENTILVTAQEKSVDIDYNNLQHLIKLDCGEERQTLIRIEGPFVGFKACHNILNLINPKLRLITSNDQNKFQMISIGNASNIETPHEAFTQNLLNTKSLCIICPHPIYPFIDNIKMKFVEGCGVSNCILIDPYEFAHGTYQSLINHRDHGNLYPIIYFDTNCEEQQRQCLEKSLSGFNIWHIKSDLTTVNKIFEFEITINCYLLQLIERCNYNQRDWPGKSTQSLIYDYL
jgi:hypothetical protein